MDTSEVCKQCKGRYCTRKISIFGILDEKQQQEINKYIIHRTYKKGQILYSQGAVSDKFYLITSGKIKLSKYTHEGNEQVLYIVSKGDYLGDLSLLKKDICLATAEALEDTVVCVLTKDDFDTVLRKNVDLALKVMEIYHDRIQSLESLLQMAGMKEVEKRLAALLLNFIKTFGNPTKDGIELDIPLSREDMANHIGTSRETVSRKLSMMQDEGVIELSGNKTILIRDISYLEKVCS